MHVEPITCYRPRPEAAPEFASPPYDVFDEGEARDYVARHPRSFLAIDRPETSFPAGHDPHADDVYERAHELLAARVTDGTLLRDGMRCYYLYRLRSQGHEQTGIVAACSVDDYNNGIVGRHELTREDKETDRVRHIEATGCQTSPVLLAYRDNPVLEVLIEAAKAAEPLYDFSDERGVRHTIWRVARPAAVESLRMMLEHVDRAYIADGHHRAAAAAHVCRDMRTGEKDHCSGNEAYNYLLCALFPASQLTILPYHRVVADVAGLSEDELVAALADAGIAVGERQDEPVLASGPGEFGMYAFGAWRRLWMSDADGSTSEAELLQERVLGPILGIKDARGDARLSFVGGTSSPKELEHRAGEKGVAFTMCALTMGDLMRAADEGRTLPPKSTWFEPKLLSGLLIRRVNHRESVIDGALPHRSDS